jgi:uncharacterized protein YlxW (UPF0749 family)
MRQHVVTVMAATIAAVSISFAVAQASSPQPAQSSASTDTKILKELKKANSELRELNSTVSKSGSDVHQIRRAMGDSAFSGSTTSVLGLLHTICGNTNSASPSGTCY